MLGYLVKCTLHVIAGTEQTDDTSNPTVSSSTTGGEGPPSDVNPPQGFTTEHIVWVVAGASLLVVCGLGAISLVACVALYKARTRRPDGGTPAGEDHRITTSHGSVYRATVGMKECVSTHRCAKEPECSSAGSAGRTRESIAVTANVCYDIPMPSNA